MTSAGKDHPLTDEAQNAQADTERRIIRLEEKLAYQEETIDHLDDVIRNMSAAVRKLRQDMDDLQDIATPLDLTRTAEDDIPPHSAPPPR